jgi:hypothetical protein
MLQLGEDRFAEVAGMIDTDRDGAISLVRRNNSSTSRGTRCAPAHATADAAACNRQR